MLAGTKIRVLKKSVAMKIRNPKDIPVTKEFEELVNIEDLRRGDYVLSWNEKTGRQTYSKVTDTYTKKTDEIYILTLQSGEKIETTWNHSFRVMKSERTANREKRIAGISSLNLKPQALQVSLHSAFGQTEEKPDAENSEWREARRLKKGDVLFDSTGRQLRIRDVQIEKRTETVYNFTVEGEHDYYVGEDGVLVHNEGCIIISMPNIEPTSPYVNKLNDFLKSNPNLSFLNRIELKEIVPQKVDTGHSAIALIDKNGKVQYFEYGHYGANGLVRKIDYFPSLSYDDYWKFNPSSQSMNNLLESIANHKQVANINATYIPINKNAYDEIQKRIIDDKNFTGKYNSLTNNCAHFVCNAYWGISPKVIVPDIDIVYNPLAIKYKYQTRQSK